MSPTPRNAFAAIRPVRNLVIIEAPGKLGALSFALKRIGLESFHVLATQGHVVDYPQDLGQLGIDTNLRETGRRIVKPQIVETIRKWSQAASRVLIATDADQEGDVLAIDLAQAVLGEHPNVLRVGLRALDVDGISRAFSSPEPIHLPDAWPGASRRILDRLIGATFSGTTKSGVEMAAGRIQSGLLGAAAANPLPIGVATLTLAAEGSRDPFVASIEVFEHNRREVESLMETAIRCAQEGLVVKPGACEPAENFKPWCYGEGVLAIAEATGRSIDDVAKSMQRLYENGRMSYPRSGANAITPQAIGKIERLAEAHGTRFDSTRLSQFSRQSRHAHESPHPLGSDVDLSSPILLLSQDEAVLSLLARHLVACGQPHVVQRPEPGSLPDWAKSLDVKRRTSAWLNPWPRRKPETHFNAIGAAEQAMALMLQNELGRPSTQVSHALKFAARGLLNSSMGLTDKGTAWVAETPKVLLDAKVSARIEQLISGGMGVELNPSPQTLVRDILEGMGIWRRVEETCANGVSIRSSLDASEML